MTIIPRRADPVPYPRFDGTQPCLETGVESFFPETGEELYHAPRQLKPICERCPFLQECRDYAISHAVTGFWGGMTYAERRHERRCLGIRAIQVTANDVDFVRQLIDELDDGVTDSAVIAAQVGCSSQTVLRHRRRRAAEGEGEVA